MVRKPEMIVNVQQTYYTEKVQGLMRQIPDSMRNPLPEIPGCGNGEMGR